MLWSVAQCYGLVDFGLGQILRPKYDADAAATTAMIWFVSIPFGMGSGVLALTRVSLLKRHQLLLAILPWIVTTTEATTVLWILFK